LTLYFPSKSGLMIGGAFAFMIIATWITHRITNSRLGLTSPSVFYWLYIYVSIWTSQGNSFCSKFTMDAIIIYYSLIIFIRTYARKSIVAVSTSFLGFHFRSFHHHQLFYSVLHFRFIHSRLQADCHLHWRFGKQRYSQDSSHQGFINGRIHHGQSLN
jgi:hypothetical protein